jgi:hypothetical protein
VLQLFEAGTIHDNVVHGQPERKPPGTLFRVAEIHDSNPASWPQLCLQHEDRKASCRRLKKRVQGFRMDRDFGSAPMEQMKVPIKDL